MRTSNILEMLGFDTTDTTLSPDLGGTAFNESPDFFPDDALSTSGINPEAPAVRDDRDDVVSLLRRIDKNTRKPPDHGPTWITNVFTIPNTAFGEQSIAGVVDFKHLFVSKAPRILNVYAGRGRTLFLGQIPVGKSLRAALPFPVDGVTVEWVGAGGGGTEQVVIVLSSEKFEVEIL